MQLRPVLHAGNQMISYEIQFCRYSEHSSLVVISRFAYINRSLLQDITDITEDIAKVVKSHIFLL